MRRRLCALRLAGYEPDELFLEAQRKLAVVVISTAPYEPPTRPHEQVVQQAVQDKSTRFSLGWHGGDPLAFLDAAKHLPHPAHEADLGLPPDLIDAIRFIVRKRESIVAWRERRMDLLLDCKRMVDHFRRRMLADMEPSIRHVCAEYDPAFMALLINATAHPDVYIVRNFVKGFATHGFIPSCGIYATGGDPPDVPTEQVVNPISNRLWNAKLRASTYVRGHKAAASPSSDAWTAVKTVWDATIKECVGGWCLGVEHQPGQWRGFHPEELDAHPWLRGPGTWRSMRRFGVEQKGKIRPCDDGSENGINSITGSLDKLSLIRPDSPAHVAAAFAREQMRWQDELIRLGTWSTHHGSAILDTVDRYYHGSDDCKKAYRRIPCRNPGLMVVCLFNPETKTAEYFIIPGFCFGYYSAVLGWNRITALYTHLGRRLLAIPATGYYDDFQIGGPWYDQPSSQGTFNTFVDMFGPGFDESKHVGFDEPAVNLGVLSDFSRVHIDATVTLGVTEERKDKLRATVRGVFADYSIRRAQSTKLFGKSRFVLCPIFGRVGLGVLQPLQTVKTEAPVVPGSEVYESLASLLEILDRLQPVVYSLFRRRDWAVVILSDASFDMATGSGGLGVVIWCPQRRELFYTAVADTRKLVAILRDIQLKKTYITQLELIAAVCAYTTWPDILRHRLAHHFIDNRPARAGLIKGSSGKPDSARIINKMHVELMALQCQTWFGFVYSEDNLSDGPSRGDFGLLQRLGAIWRPCKLPRIDCWALPRPPM